MTQLVGIRLKLLGGLSANCSVDSKPVPVLRKKALAILAVLAMAPGFKATRIELATLLWGDLPESQSRQNFRQCLHQLRKALPAADILSVDTDTVALSPALVDVDVIEFQTLIRSRRPSDLYGAARL